MSPKNPSPANRLRAWERSAYGRFALEQEKKFLLQLTADWRRRHRSMLVLECATGIIPEVFWEAGFDVSATSASSQDLQTTRSRVGHRADLHLTSPEHMPFEDKAYDYVMLITVLNECTQPEAVLKEASRVCAKNLLISFVNKTSIFAFSLVCPGLNIQCPVPRRFWSWPSLLLLVHRVLGQRPVRTQGGILPGPHLTWRPGPLGRFINSWLWPNSLGAYCALTLDMTNEPVNTPLLAWVQRPKPSAPCAHPSSISKD